MHTAMSFKTGNNIDAEKTQKIIQNTLNKFNSRKNS